jgi:hypothetical protein
MNPEDMKNIAKELQQKEETVSTPEELADFIADLLAAYEDGYFESQGVFDYLGGMQGLLTAHRRWAPNVSSGEQMPEQPNWRWVAKLLHSSFWYN